MLRITLAILVLFGLGGCASYFKRKECEKANMYQHGFDVAMAGKRLDADDFVKQCQKVEAKFSFTELDTGFKAGMAKYCTSDNVFQVGKSGKPFSYEMCDGESVKKMRARYEEGLKIFCVPANGYRFGSSGGIYLNVCPKDSEEKWLVEYRKGRKIWLVATIEETQREVDRLGNEIWSLEGQRSGLEFEKRHLDSRTTVHREQVYDSFSNRYEEKVTEVPDESARLRSQEISGEISDIDRRIWRLRSEQSEKNKELSKMRTEMVTL